MASSVEIDPKWLVELPRQNSRVVLMPGSGAGYFPLAPATSGAGQSAVSMSAVGANSCSQFSMSSRVRPVALMNSRREGLESWFSVILTFFLHSSKRGYSGSGRIVFPNLANLDGHRFGRRRADAARQPHPVIQSVASKRNRSRTFARISRRRSKDTRPRLLNNLALTRLSSCQLQGAPAGQGGQLPIVRRCYT